MYDQTKECIIVDGGCYGAEENQELGDFVKSANLKPVKLINTHCHVDHVLGCKFIVEEFKIPFLIHKEEDHLLQRSVEQGLFFGINVNSPPVANQYIEEGQTINFGDSNLGVLHLPGHSPGSIGLLNEEQKFILVGDVLFKGGIGRTDIPGGDYNTLINSIKSKLLMQESQTIVYPGHGVETTIEEERSANPFLT